MFAMRGSGTSVGVRLVTICAVLGLLALSGALAGDEGANDLVAGPEVVGGVGIVITGQRTDAGDGIALVVGELLDEGPAAAAGIREGDRLTHVDGAPIAGLSLEKVVDLIRGKPGTEVKLTVQRAGQEGPMEFTMKRAALEWPPPAADRETRERLRAERAEDFQRMAAEQGQPFRFQVRPGQQGAIQFVGPGGPRPLGGGPAPEAVPAQMLVQDGHVYVLRGYMLYQFEVEGLKLVGQADLRTDEEKERMEKAGQMPPVRIQVQPRPAAPPDKEE